MIIRYPWGYTLFPTSMAWSGTWISSLALVSTSTMGTPDARRVCDEFALPKMKYLARKCRTFTSIMERWSHMTLVQGCRHRQLYTLDQHLLKIVTHFGQDESSPLLQVWMPQALNTIFKWLKIALSSMIAKCTIYQILKRNECSSRFLTY